MTEFHSHHYVVDGVQVQVLEAGSGRPTVYFHGAGTSGGFAELLPLAAGRRLIVPIHPGFGASQDDPGIDSIIDYVVHYAALFDAIGLDEPVDLVGHSLGGWIASLFAVFNRPRVRRLALACPAGLHVPEHPTADLFTIPAEQLPGHLIASPQVLAQMAQMPVTIDLRVSRYREMTTLARVAWDRNYDPKLSRWLVHIRAPVLLLWGEADRVVPVEQAQAWARRLPTARVTSFPAAGHLLFVEAPAAVQALASFFDAADVAQKKAS